MDSVVFLIVIIVMMVLLMMDGGSEGAPAKSSLQIVKFMDGLCNFKIFNRISPYAQTAKSGVQVITSVDA